MKVRYISIPAILLAVLIALTYTPASTIAQNDGHQAQDIVPSIRFTHLTTEDSLPRSVVTAILQDSRRFDT